MAEQLAQLAQDPKKGGKQQEIPPVEVPKTDEEIEEDKLFDCFVQDFKHTVQN